jgi:DNA repair protein RadA/Sms
VTSSPLQTILFSEIAQTSFERISTGMAEVDQVLGGGIVPGSFILLGGEPGIGKSTLLGQITLSLSHSVKEKPILYCSGEESAEQTKLRFDRIARDASLERIHFLGETNSEKICATIEHLKPAFAVIDSIQTISSAVIPSEAGSISQVRACTVQLLEIAKKNTIPIIITGHVTKEGMVAGPKTLEHLVDTVLYLEGDTHHHFRLLKTVKNRFGSTNEIGVFEMAHDGLHEISNPSSVFLSGSDASVPGTVTTAVIEGSRAFLMHVQALTTKTYFGYPQRRSVGFDTNRLQLLIAVLTKRVGLNLGDQDIHINVVGGCKITEPAADLAVAASILSAYKNSPIPSTTLLIGELGLGGELRSIANLEKRLKEAEKLGFTNAYIPATSKKIEGKLKLFPLKHIKELEL